MQRLNYLVAFLLALQFSTSFAASTREFTDAAAEAAKKYRTTVGRDYAAGVMRSVAPALAKAMRACGSREFKPQSFYELVFVVSPAGSVTHVLSTPTSPFARCIAAHLQLPASVSKPPKGSWPIHIRLLHGRMLLDEPDPPFNIFSDDIRPPLIRPNHAMELTTSRGTTKLSLTTSFSPAAARALARGSSSCSR